MSAASPPPPPLAIAAVLLFSSDPDRLAAFYRDVIGAPLQRVSLPGLEPHWACDIQHVYLSIWPIAAADDGAEPAALSEVRRAGVAFYVRDVATELARLESLGVRVDFAAKRTPVGIIARLRDPDGNPFELYQPLA